VKIECAVYLSEDKLSSWAYNLDEVWIYGTDYSFCILITRSLLKTIMNTERTHKD